MPRRAVRLSQRRRSIHPESSGPLGFLSVYAWLLHLARIPAHLPKHEDVLRYKYHHIENRDTANGKVICLIHDLNPIATHFPYSTANSYNAIARFRSDAMAQAVSDCSKMLKNADLKMWTKKAAGEYGGLPFSPAAVVSESYPSIWSFIR